jgi:hypothetical protein
MKLHKHSEERLYQAFRTWELNSPDYVAPLHNYLVYGFSPGGFFRAILANDCIGALRSSHPANSIPELKKVAGFIDDRIPGEAKGSYEAVDAWCKKPESERRAILEECRLIYTAKEETILTLKC